MNLKEHLRAVWESGISFPFLLFMGLHIFLNYNLNLHLKDHVWEIELPNSYIITMRR